MDTPQETIIPKGLMFKFPKVSYTLQSRGDGRDSSKLNFDMQTITIASVLSCAWAGLVIAYGAGLTATIGKGEMPSFVYASLVMLVIFPVCLIWGGFFVYHYINQSHKASIAILEAARILGSPALVASEDVKTLSSAVGHELNNLRSAMRDVEDNMNGISKRIDSEINTLNESSDKLHHTLSDVSGIIRAERDAIVDLMKIIKAENNNARNHLAERHKTHIQVSDIETDNTDKISEKPAEVGELAGGEITYVHDLRMSPTVQKGTETVRKPIQFSPNPMVKNDTPVYTAKPEAIILKRERQLYEGVCALSVDLNRELGIPLPQDLWSRYMRGERHVFADHLFQKLSHNFMEYQDKLDSEALRKLSNQFVARFETLRERLFDEPDVAVSEYLENSGVGKIYNILSAEYV
jgi:hypothetical protein